MSRTGIPSGAGSVPTHTAPAAIHGHPGWATATGAMSTLLATTQGDRAVQHYQRALGALAQHPGEAVSLAISVPFCAAHCLCCARDVNAAQPAEVIDDYVDGLIEEAQAVAGQGAAGRDVLQLHLGGGTANELNEPQLLRLMQTLQTAWRVPADTEMSVECDPRRSGWSQLQLLRGLGFRRVVFGVLDLDAAVQRAIGRCHSPALIEDVCDVARSCGMELVELQLMIGLPYQSGRRWRSTLQRVVGIAPDRVTLARYRHQPWNAPVQHAIDVDTLPDADERRALLAQTAEALGAAGYRRVGADHWVLDTDELLPPRGPGRPRRSLISYTVTPPVPVLGLGAGAVGEIDGNVFWNEASLPRWRQAVRAGGLAVAHAQLATPHELHRRQAVEQLLCGLELPAEAVRGGLEDAYQRIARHEADGLVRVLADRIVVTEAGRHALPLLCQELDATRWLS